MARPVSTEPIESRLWRLVDRRGPDECWDHRQLDSYGYGRVYVGGTRRTLRAHRVAYEVTFGPIPDGLVVRHRCDNRACCNPAHLETGTQQDNVRDAVDRGRVRMGESHGMAKLTDQQVEDIRASLMPVRELALRYAVTASCIYKTRQGVRHGPT